mmetsp:Transcript_108396/g.301304  ORF Transcript_108396/g.301304 Transcript_108396/m.301304 type:complete len:299 (+) Transcript_108396:318-1214(+)
MCSGSAFAQPGAREPWANESASANSGAMAGAQLGGCRVRVCFDRGGRQGRVAEGVCGQQRRRSSSVGPAPGHGPGPLAEMSRGRSDREAVDRGARPAGRVRPAVRPEARVVAIRRPEGRHGGARPRSDGRTAARPLRRRRPHAPSGLVATGRLGAAATSVAPGVGVVGRRAVAEHRGLRRLTDIGQRRVHRRCRREEAVARADRHQRQPGLAAGAVGLAGSRLGRPRHSAAHRAVPRPLMRRMPGARAHVVCFRRRNLLRCSATRSTSGGEPCCRSPQCSADTRTQEPCYAEDIGRRR